MALLEVEDVLQTASVGFWNLKIVFMFCASCLMSATAPMFYPIAFAELDFECAKNDSVKNQCFYQDSNNSTVECTTFNYLPGVFDSSARKDFNLACGRSMFADLDLSVMLIGQCFSVTVCNFLMDAFGRKPVFNISCCLAALCSIGYLLAPSVEVLLLLRWIDCFTLMSLTVSGFLMMVENLPLKYSVYATNASEYMYGIGFFLCALVSYFFRTWRWYVTLRMVIPALLTALLSLLFIDESPRWLLQRRKFIEFEKVVKKLFHQNKKEFPPFLAKEIKSMKELVLPAKDSVSVLKIITAKLANVKFWKLYRTNKTAMWMAVMGLSWIANVVVYFGMQFGEELFGGVEIHFYFMINGIAEIPGTLFQLYVAKHWGRKPANIISFMLCALSLLICPLIPKEGYWVILIYVAAFSTRIFISSAFVNIYMWNAEILPTNLRGVGMGLGSLCGRIVGIPLPYVKQLSKMWAPLPAFIFAAIAFVAAVASFVVPETRNRISPDDIEEFEAFGTSKYNELKQKRLEVLKKKTISNQDTLA